MGGGILMNDPCDDITMIYLRIGVIFDHMIIKDCYEAGMMTEEAWKSYLKNMMYPSTKEDDNEN